MRGPTSSIDHPSAGSLGAGGVDAAFDEAYTELKALARRAMANERTGHTLQPTALISEAYVRLRKHRGTFASREAFCAAIAVTIRRVLIDYARRKKAQQQVVSTQLEVGNLSDRPGVEAIDILALDEALTALAQANAQHAEIATSILFGGLTCEEIASLEGVSARTIRRDWQCARLFIMSRLS
ncbi:MAG: sigma-70 family RNA polymerase sigma factor [Phycisphaerales bacterium]|nr:sigma-70 family RNA polymerase sigma factor [Phycisphaerales bacterium]